MKALFIVATPYHLFSVFNICDDLKLPLNERDLLILDFGTDITNRFDMNVLNKTFKNVYIRKIISNNKITKRLHIVSEIIKGGDFGTHIDFKYDSVYISETESYSKEIAFSVGKENYKLYYFEDGLGTYTDVLDINQKNARKNI